MKKPILLLCFLGAWTFSFATNYYVSPTGSNTNDGSEQTPFKTINKAASLLVAGDTCFIMAGTYREELDPAKGGTANNPIVFTRYQNDSVLISATEPAGTWTLHSGDVYRTDYNMTLGRKNMVFVNGTPMDWARWPNNVDGDPYTVEAISVTNGTASTVESSEITNMNWVGGYMWYLGGHSGTSWTREITASETGKITFQGVDISKWPFNPHNPTLVRNGSRGQFFLFGVLEALDHEREWYADLDNDVVYLQAPGNVDPNTLDVEFSARKRTMLLSKPYIHVDGINAFGGKVEITGANCVVRNGTFTHCLEILDELDNTDAQAGEGAIHVRASHTLIEHNIIDGSSISGIFVQGWNNVVSPTLQHNIIRNCNTVGIHASPIRSASSNNYFYANTIQTTGRDGIYCAGVDNEIAYNDISDCMRINNDGGLFYTVGNDFSRNTEIHHNWFHDSEGPAYADGRAAGIYLDNDSKGFTVHHNVVWNITWSGVQMNWDIWDNNIYHNTLWEVGQAMGTWLKPEHTMERIRIYNNVANEPDWIGNDIQNNVILASSPFEDVASHNFVPVLGSAVHDAGRDIAGINGGHKGVSPDIGAYEAGVTPWIPGTNPVEDVSTITSLEDSQTKWNLTVFPNPARNNDVQVRLAGHLGEKLISLYRENGKLICQVKTMQEQVSLPQQYFKAKGLYLVRISDGQQSWTHKLLID